MSIYGANIARVSEVAGLIQYEKDGLLNWAAREGFQWQNTRQRLAAVGNHTHALVQHTLNTEPAKFVEENRKVAPVNRRYVDNAFKAFGRWCEGKTIEPLAVEQTLKNEKLGFAGTPDFIGLVDGYLVLIDWKTSSDIRTQHLIQLAGYQLLIEQFSPHQPTHYGVIKLGRDTGYPGEYWMTPEQMAVAKNTFLAALTAYKGKQVLCDI